VHLGAVDAEVSNVVIGIEKLTRSKSCMPGGAGS
jgi:hypothetical protein